MPKLPLYEIKLDQSEESEQGVKFVSLVHDPAIRKTWVAFAKANFHPNCRCEINKNGTVVLSDGACEFCKDAKRTYNAARRSGNRLPKGIDWPDELNFSSQDPIGDFKFADEEKRMLAGPFMIPNTPIYRVDDDGNEYNVFFTEQTIREIAKRFSKEARMNYVDQEHTNLKAPAFVFESWIVEDPKVDKSNLYGFNLPKGTWFGTVHVEDESYWADKVKSGEVRGFSIQGLLSQSQKPSNQAMSKHNFSAKTADGKMIGNADGSESLKVGDSVVWLNEDGTTAPVEMEKVRLEDGNVLVIQDSKIVEILSDVPEDSMDPAMMEDSKDKEKKEKMAEPVMVNRQDFDNVMMDLANTITDLSTRIAKLESELAASKETITKQAEQIKKFSAHTPGAKSITLSKAPETKEIKANKPVRTLAALEAAANFRNRN